MADKVDQIYSHFSSACWALKRWTTSAAVFLFFIILLVGAFFLRIDDHSFVAGRSKSSIGYQLNCSNQNIQKTCKASHPVKRELSPEISDAACPEYFRWIHEDLRPWKSTGISRDTLEKARNVTDFRLVIVNGTAYVEKYQKAFQTRDVFTLWGILQLLRLYPGRVPDLELIFRCDDIPIIQKRNYPNASLAPPMFQYCGHDDALGIVFPDWSFWGWAEINIRPWEGTLAKIMEGSKKTRWEDRVPYAYWKGNPHVSPKRGDLMKCRASDKHDWNARLYSQDWLKEIKQGFKHSNLEDQCTHRYKIYIEGRGWSVSSKYILACDSMTLLIKPDYHDFFMRGMTPMQHYWPIRPDNKCRDIKFAVQWGNTHPDKAQAIGRAGSAFIEEDLKLKNVYAYMFHTLSEYAKLLKFKPKIPPGATELCLESMACSEDGLGRKFMVESMVTSPSDALPCTMPPPYDPPALQAFFERKDFITRQVGMWEYEYWKILNKKESKSPH